MHSPGAFAHRGLGCHEPGGCKICLRFPCESCKGQVGSREARIRLEKLVRDRQWWPSSLKEAGAGPGEVKGLLEAVGTRGMLWGLVQCNGEGWQRLKEPVGSYGWVWSLGAVQ